MCDMRGDTNTVMSGDSTYACGSRGSGTTSRSPTATSTGTLIAAASSLTQPGSTISIAHGGNVADPHTGTRPRRG